MTALLCCRAVMCCIATFLLRCTALHWAKTPINLILIVRSAYARERHLNTPPHPPPPNAFLKGHAAVRDRPGVGGNESGVSPHPRRPLSARLPQRVSIAREGVRIPGVAGPFRRGPGVLLSEGAGVHLGSCGRCRRPSLSW